MKIINFFRSKNGDFEYAVCDDGNVYRRFLSKGWTDANWSEWELWVNCEDIENDQNSTKAQERRVFKNVEDLVRHSKQE